MIKKTLLSNSTYPTYTKIWLLLYLVINFLFGASFFYTHASVSSSIPYIALALINMYGISLLLRQNKQGFYTSFSSEIIFFAFTLITKKPTVYITITLINFVFLLITWICVRKLWNKAQDNTFLRNIRAVETIFLVSTALFTHDTFILVIYILRLNNLRIVSCFL